MRLPWRSDKANASVASSGAARREEKLSLAQISQIVGLPEERLAQISQLIASGTLPEEQMGPMVHMAHGKGLETEQIMQMMRSLGVPEDRIARVLASQGLATPEQVRAAEEERRRANRARLARKALIVLFWLAVWEIADRVVDNRLILAGPIRTIQALVEQLAQSDFWMICLASTGRIALGFLLSFSVGILLALVASKVRLVREFLDPLMSLLKTIPMVSFIIMLLIWVGNQALTVYLSFLIVLPLIYINMLTGFDHVDKQMLEMAHAFGLSPWRRFMYVYRPAFMPFLLSSCKMSIGMSWKAGVMAEVLATPKPSIGKEMMEAKTFLATPDLFAWTVVVIVLSLVFEKAFMELLKRAARPMGGMLGRKD